MYQCFGSWNYPPSNPACNPSTANRSRHWPGDLELVVRSSFWHDLGTTILSAVFNNRFSVLVKRITDPTVVSMLADANLMSTLPGCSWIRSRIQRHGARSLICFRIR
jgi:hypothetical protein